MKRISIYSIILLNLLIGDSFSPNSYEKVRNAFYMGLDDKAKELALDIISSPKDNKDRENTLFMLSEYYFSEAIKENELQIAHRAFTFYNLFQKDYSKSERMQVVELRLKFLSSLFKELKFTGDYLSQNYNKFAEIKQLIQIANIYKMNDTDNQLVKNHFGLLIDTENSFQIADKYYDKIILNYPDFAPYGYYFKIKNYLSNSKRWSSAEWMRDIDAQTGANNYKITVEIIESLLEGIRKEFPENQYILDLHIMFATTIWNADRIAIGKKDKKRIVKKTIQYVLENEPDQLSFRHTFAKEFIIRNF